MKYIIITGASKGIGRAAALQFAKKGAHLFLSARSSLEELVPLIEKQGASVSAFQADLSVSGEADKMMEAAIEEMRQSTLEEAVLINNAGMVDPVGPAASIKVKKYQSIWSLICQHRLYVPHILSKVWRKRVFLRL
nr:SDR family NAD(P)-dependent oxidoreductase [Sinobaca sp. H24]